LMVELSPRRSRAG